MPSSNPPNLKEKWFYYFIALSEHKNLKAAAQSLGITVQSLNQNLAELEKRLKNPLIERKTPQLKLTPEGTVFLQQSLEFVEELKKLEANFSLESEVHTLSLAWCHSWFPAIFPSLMRQLCREEAALYPRIQCCPRESLEALVLDGEIELGMGFSAPESPELDFYCGAPIPYVIVAVPPVSKNWQDLRFATFASKSNRWDDIRYPRKIVVEAEDPFIVLDVCLNAGCAAYLPAHLVAPLVRNKSLEIVADPPERHEITPYILWKKAKKLDTVSLRTLELLKRLLPKEFLL